MKAAMVVVVVAAVTTAMASLAVGCASEDGTTAKPSSSDASAQSTSLSVAFTVKCARCHGSTGTGQGAYPSLPGSHSETSFAAIVRSGRNDMPSFDAAQISDADLAADYEWMKTKR